MKQEKDRGRSNAPDNGKRGLHVNEFSHRYGMSRSTVYKLMDSGKLRSVKIAGRRIIPDSEGERLLSEGT